MGIGNPGIRQIKPASLPVLPGFPVNIPKNPVNIENFPVNVS
jgi:hypothetical protein